LIKGMQLLIKGMQRKFMEKSVVFVIARQRSGTNLLRRSLSASPIFFDLNEIFFRHPPQVQGANRYWDYLKASVAADTDLVVPTEKNQTTLLDGYLKDRIRHVHSGKPGAILLADVKYNTTCNNDPIWHSPLEKPYLLEYIRKRKIRVIHLTRDNIFQACLSTRIAVHRQSWVELGETPADSNQHVDKLHIPRSELVADIDFRSREIEYFRNAFKVLDISTLELSYESLLEKNTGQDRLARSVINRLEQFLDIELGDFNPGIPTRKLVTRRYAEIIGNYPELMTAVREMGRGDWLE